MSRVDFLRQIWEEVINLGNVDWLDRLVEEAEARPDAPFADAGLAIQRALAAGATRQDLTCFARMVSYEAVFSTLYMLGDPGVGDDDASMLHEDLLGADPSGLEGRPGSWQAPE